jgi:hypothetical protein
MRHFHRTSLHPDAVLATADAFFPTIGLRPAGQGPRSRTFTGVVGTPEVPGTLELTVRMEGGHYTFIEAHTDQVGESRLDRNVKRFFVEVHKQVDAKRSFAPAY